MPGKDILDFLNIEKVAEGLLKKKGLGVDPESPKKNLKKAIDSPDLQTELIQILALNFIKRIMDAEEESEKIKEQLIDEGLDPEELYIDGMGEIDITAESDIATVRAIIIAALAKRKEKEELEEIEREKEKERLADKFTFLPAFEPVEAPTRPASYSPQPQLTLTATSSINVYEYIAAHTKVLSILKGKMNDLLYKGIHFIEGNKDPKDLIITIKSKDDADNDVVSTIHHSFVNNKAVVKITNPTPDATHILAQTHGGNKSFEPLTLAHCGIPELALKTGLIFNQENVFLQLDTKDLKAIDKQLKGTPDFLEYNKKSTIALDTKPTGVQGS